MHKLYLTTAVALLLAGCGPQQQPATPAHSAPRPVSRPQAQPRSISPADYVARAGAIDLYEIEAAKLALRVSGRKTVREFATMMLQAHEGTSGQLSLAGRRLNLLPSVVLANPFAQRLAQLREAADFDSAYKNQQLAVHREAVAIHSAYAARGTSPTLRPVASAALPVMQRHLRLVQYL